MISLKGFGYKTTRSDYYKRIDYLAVHRVHYSYEKKRYIAETIAEMENITLSFESSVSMVLAQVSSFFDLMLAENRSVVYIIPEKGFSMEQFIDLRLSQVTFFRVDVVEFAERTPRPYVLEMEKTLVKKEDQGKFDLAMDYEQVVIESEEEVTPRKLWKRRIDHRAFFEMPPFERALYVEDMKMYRRRYAEKVMRTAGLPLPQTIELNSSDFNFKRYLHVMTPAESEFLPPPQAFDWSKEALPPVGELEFKGISREGAVLGPDQWYPVGTYLFYELPVQNEEYGEYKELLYVDTEPNDHEDLYTSKRSMQFVAGDSLHQSPELDKHVLKNPTPQLYCLECGLGQMEINLYEAPTVTNQATIIKFQVMKKVMSAHSALRHLEVEAVSAFLDKFPGYRRDAVIVLRQTQILLSEQKQNKRRGLEIEEKRKVKKPRKKVLEDPAKSEEVGLSTSQAQELSVAQAQQELPQENSEHPNLIAIAEINTSVTDFLKEWKIDVSKLPWIIKDVSAISRGANRGPGDAPATEDEEQRFFELAQRQLAMIQEARNQLKESSVGSGSQESNELVSRTILLSPVMCDESVLRLALHNLLENRDSLAVIDLTSDNAEEPLSQRPAEELEAADRRKVEQKKIRLNSVEAVIRRLKQAGLLPRGPSTSPQTTQILPVESQPNEEPARQPPAEQPQEDAIMTIEDGSEPKHPDEDQPMDGHESGDAAGDKPQNNSDNEDLF